MENTGNTKGIPSGNQTETGIPMMMAVGMMMSEDEDDGNDEDEDGEDDEDDDDFMINLFMIDD